MICPLFAQLFLDMLTGTFFTIINFCTLNLLQRIHKLSILQELQSTSEREAHCFHFARQERYSTGKEGVNSFEQFELVGMQNEDIVVHSL